jgi:NAD dependent epimerase/dehydratase family enzyme
MPNGIWAPAPIIELGSFFLRTESELVLKSRRVVPRRLLDAGFQFEFPTWSEAASDLVRRWRERNL